MLVLSLFPGVGLLDKAFELEGYSIARGPDYIWGGDVRRYHVPPGRFDGVIGGPPCQTFSRLAHMVRHNGYEPKFGNLIPEFERIVAEAKPQWFAMEEVPDAPTPSVEGYGVHSFILNNRQCIDESGKPATQNRSRRWSFGWRGGRHILPVDVTVFENPQWDYAACGGSSGSSLGAAGWDGGPEKKLTRKSGIPIAIGGSGKLKPAMRKGSLNQAQGGNIKSEAAFRRLCRLQGLPDDFDLEPFTVSGKCKAVGNGVPLPMGRAIARAIREVVEQQTKVMS